MHCHWSVSSYQHHYNLTRHSQFDYDVLTLIAISIIPRQELDAETELRVNIINQTELIVILVWAKVVDQGRKLDAEVSSWNRGDKSCDNWLDKLTQAASRFGFWRLEAMSRFTCARITCVTSIRIERFFQRYATLSSFPGPLFLA